MRTIKFRAWCEGKHENMTFTEAHMDYEVTIKNGMYADVESGWDIHGTYPTIPIMQFTGLKDKNGTEIYEGDIVEAWSAGSKGIFQVKWRQEGSPCWLLYPNFQERQHWSIHATEHKVGKQFISVDGKITTTDLDGFYDDGLTVIGNIHQNPELLK